MKSLVRGKQGLVSKILTAVALSAVISGCAPVIDRLPAKHDVYSKQASNEDKVRELINGLGFNDEDGQVAAIQALGRMKDKRIVPALINVLSYHGNNKSRIFAILNLGYLQDKRAVPALIRELEGGASAYRGLAAYALGWINDKRALPALIRAAEDGDPTVQRGAIYALGKIKDKRAVPVLWKVSNDQNGLNSLEAAKAIIKIGKAAFPMLMGYLKDNKENHTQYTDIVWMLGGIKDRRAVPALIEALECLEMLVRREAAKALGKIGDKRAAHALTKALKDPHAQVMGAAENALRLLGR